MKRKLITVVILVWISEGCLFAQSEPWKAGILTDEFIYEKAPFPSCHAATIEETDKGLVAAWFGGTHERHPDVGIWVSRKEGDQWTAPVEVANGVQPDGSRMPTWNPVLYQVPEGDLLLFYKIGPKPSAWKGFMKSSKNGGITWSEQKALPEGYIGPVKNKPVLLSNGNLLCPSSTEGDGWKVHFEITPDFGETWKMVGPVAKNGHDAIQPTVLQYGDGKLQALSRSKSRAIVENWSDDHGKTWSPLATTSLPNNNSGLDGVTLQDGRQLLVYNHVLPPDGEVKGPRTPLHVSVSKDGKTWYAALILEDSPISQYSYPSVIQTKDGMVHIVYTWRRERIKHVKVDPSQLELVMIEDGQWPEHNSETNTGK